MFKEKFVLGVLRVATFLATLCVGLIFFFLLYFSYPLLKSGVIKKLFAVNWNPDYGQFGILPMVLGTFYISGLALLIAVPVGIAFASFLHSFSPRLLRQPLERFVEFMAGIPTVVYGFAGLFLLVPVIRKFLPYSSGLCILSAGIMLSLVIFPTLVLVIKTSFESVPEAEVLMARALGATESQVFWHVILPRAWKGIVSGVVLAAGRAIGDTLIALMLAGNSVAIPHSLFDSARTLTSHIALITAADYDSIQFKTIFLCGLLLFFISLLNISFLKILQKIRGGHF